MGSIRLRILAMYLRKSRGIRRLGIERKIEIIKFSDYSFPDYEKLLEYRLSLH